MSPTPHTDTTGIPETPEPPGTPGTAEAEEAAEAAEAVATGPAGHRGVLFAMCVGGRSPAARPPAGTASASSVR